MDKEHTPPKQKRKNELYRSILSLFWDKFSKSGRYPLSVHSGINSSSPQNTCESPDVSWHPPDEPQSSHDSCASSHHQCLPSMSSASSESEASLSDSIMESEVMRALAREGPTMMKVKTATVCHNDPLYDYKMTARPRGYCLIVNNVDFEGDIFPKRKGSDEDAIRFDQIFKQLGFETIIARNLTAEKMRNKFKELSAACKPEHDALFIFILSHGSKRFIYGTDGLEVHLKDEILTCFDNRHCKAMIGKPKVFVIQACRGASKDCGGDEDEDDYDHENVTDSIAWTPGVTSQARLPANRVPTSWLPSNRPLDGRPRKHPVRSDMLLVYSCLAGKWRVRCVTILGIQPRVIFVS
jgi:hypothetical protein